jgi:hypothetical protein
MGVMGLGVKKELMLVVHDEPNDKIRHDLQKFMA